ncbi:MAG: tRNA 2-thiouridine(34) synthase MnmA [Pseudomonadota bacterium]
MARLAVALSGGVDSSVAALLLREQGHEVIGLSLRLGQGPDLAWRAGAEAAAQQGIAHQVVEAAGAFAQRVLAPSVAAYAAGRTPNPCAWCNARVKLPLLLAAAAELGCQALATGHYARLVPGPEGGEGGEGGAGVTGLCLAEGADPAKSQAYFLARVRPELLRRLRFPLGGLTKARVRELAAAAELMAAERPESQDGCFLPPGGWGELMTRAGAMRPGVIEDERGRVLARHRGLHGFTIGQRRGLGVALGHPAYVLALDGERAAVRVGPAEGLWASGLIAAAPIWRLPPAARPELRVRIRYAHQGVACRVEPGPEGVRVLFSAVQRAVAPGQLAVFTSRGLVAGSAWISQAIA